MDLNDRLAAALRYAAEGKRVFPLHGIREGRCTCIQPECGSPGKHPRERNWHKQSTTNPARIRQWWLKYPDANVGLLTGAEAGFIVVDVDGDTGCHSWEQLGLSLDLHTRTATTGRGRHFYFRHPGGVVKTRAGVLPGVDVRGDGFGGFIVAPPSHHASGRVYTFVTEGAEMAPLPAVLLPAVSGAGSGHAQKARAKRRVASTESLEDGFIPMGERNDTLYRTACAMRGRGMEFEEIKHELMRVNKKNCETPLPDNDVAKIAESAAKHPKGDRPATRVKPVRSAAAITEDNALFYFPFKPDEWLADPSIQHDMTAAQRGWYINLCCHAWKNKGVLPNDPEALRRRAGETDLSLEEFSNALDPIYAMFIVEGDDDSVLVHPIIRARWQEQYEKHTRNKAAGKRSAEKRKLDERKVA